MRWPTRILSLPLAKLRALLGLAQARAGVSSSPSMPDPQQTIDEVLATLPEEDDREFRFTPPEQDASSAPTVPDNSRAKAVIPGSERPAPFKMPRGRA